MLMRPLFYSMKVSMFLFLIYHKARIKKSFILCNRPKF